MKTWIKPFLFVSAMWVACAAVHAQDTGATTSGNWNNASIWTAGIVPGLSNTVYIGSTYPAGSAATATVTVSQNETASFVLLGYGSSSASGTLDLTGGTLAIAFNLYLGYYAGDQGIGAISESGGSFTAGAVLIGHGNSLSFGASDVTSVLDVYSGSTATTAATGNVTSSVNVYSGSTLNLGANLNLSSFSPVLDVENTGSVLNMNGHSISSDYILLGWNDSQAVTLDRGTTPGSISANLLEVYGGGGTFNLLPSDKVGFFALSDGSTTLNSGVAVGSLSLQNSATATTTSSSNISGDVTVTTGSTLNLGANLSLTGSLDVENTGSTVNAHGFNITAGTLTAGYYSTGAVSVTNVGSILLDDLYLGHGSTMSIHGGVVNDLINLGGNSVLTVLQTNGTGLTLNGTSSSSLTIDPSSMDLIFNLNTSPNWDFRWMDPSSGGNWISTLDSMIASGQIVVDAPQGYNVIDMGGYTYIEGNYTQSVVPEPSSLLLACLATLGVAAGMTWRRRHRGA